MRRAVKERSRRQAPSIEHIELNEDKLHKRFILVVLLLAVGLGAIAGAVAMLLRVDKGWREISVSAGGASCAGDFALYYDLGRGERSAAREKRALEKAYEAACRDAYVLFSARERQEGVRNLAWLNAHMNEAVRVDPALYRALEKLNAGDCRLAFLAPVYELCRGLCSAADEAEALNYDPFRSPELAAWCARGAALARDPEAVSLELLGEDTVRLKVSAECLDFLSENGGGPILDLYWLESAFRADYLAERLTAEGFPNGCLRSRDGCLRCFAPGESPFAETLWHRDETGVRPAASLPLRGGMAAVSLRAWPLTGSDREWYRVMSDGSVRSPFADLRDGLCRTALPELTGVSESLGCAELALAMAGVFIGESPDEAALGRLPEQGILALWVEGNSLRATDPAPGHTPAESFAE